MKFVSLVLLVLFASFAFATDINGCNSSGSSAQLETEGTDAVSFTIVNSFDASPQALGLDIFASPTANYILAVNKTALEVQAYDISGTPLGTLPLDATNTSCFGFVFNDVPDTDIYHTNDWSSSNLFTTEDFGVSWTTSANPAGSAGRGMDFDGTDYWQASGTDLVRFQPGAGSETVAVPGIPGQISGVAAFPYGGNIGIAVAVYQTHNLYFYEWDGSSLSSLGSAACPGTAVSSSLGLTYNPTTGNMHWAYSNTSSAYTIVEFSFDIGSALERSSWGAIKSGF